MGVAMLLVGAALMIGPLFLPPLGFMAKAVLGVVGLVLFLIGLVITVWTSLYKKTSADQAFVMTGQGGSRVVLDGGALVIPIFHRITEVNLRTMKLGVNPHGPNALITHDNLRSDILAQFYIRVQADREHILNAARSLGDNSVNAENVENLVSEKLVSALRAIASQMDLFEIHTKRDEFAERVKEHVKSDLEANGLLLESVTISELDQTDPSELSDNNVFDAQGKRKITEITAAAMVERNNLERAAEQARKNRDVTTRQQILNLERQQAEAEANQHTEILKIQAAKDREAQETQITQQRAVETAQIEKQQAVQTAEIGRQQAVEVARVGQEKAVQNANIAREQELQTAAVGRDQAVALAERVKQIAVANQEAERAKAEEKSLIAQAAQEKANAGGHHGHADRRGRARRQQEADRGPAGDRAGQDPLADRGAGVGVHQSHERPGRAGGGDQAGRGPAAARAGRGAVARTGRARRKGAAAGPRGGRPRERQRRAGAGGCRAQAAGKPAGVRRGGHPAGDREAADPGRQRGPAGVRPRPGVVPVARQHDPLRHARNGAEDDGQHGEGLRRPRDGRGLPGRREPNGNGHSANGTNGSSGRRERGSPVDALLGNLGKLVGPALKS